MRRRIPPINQDFHSPSKSLLVPRLRELLTRQPESLCFLFGSGVTAPQVPGVAEIVAEGQRWLEAGEKDEPEVPPVVGPSADLVGPESYGSTLDAILHRFGAEGQRAFLQHLSLQAYEGSEAVAIRGALSETHQPLTEDAWGGLVGDARSWIVPDGLACWARMLAAKEKLPRYVLTTNFDPLLSVALLREGVAVRTVSASTDTNVWAEHSSAREVTVLHINGDCHNMATLHTAQELRTNRPNLWAWLVDYLANKNLLVVGYSGWDDVVRDTLHTVLTPASKLNILWTVYEANEAQLEATRPRLVSLLSEWHPYAVPYYGIDRDDLFASIEPDESGRSLFGRRGRRRARSPVFEVAEELRRRFEFGHDALSSGEPRVLFWPHRLRRPHLIHGVHALAAAGLSRAKIDVELHLDDLGLEEAVADELTAEFTDAVHAWFAQAGVSTPRILRYSTQIDRSDESVRARLWGFAERLNETPTRVRELLAASKIADPRTLDAAPEAAALYVARGLDSRVDGRLLRPVYNFYLLDHLMDRHGLDRESHAVVTLGGADERPMWNLWRNMYPRQTGHIFVPRLDWRPGTNLWSVSPLLRSASYSRSDLRTFLTASLQEGESAAFVDWFWRCGIGLWHWLALGSDPSVQIDGRKIASARDAVDALKQMPSRAGEALADEVGTWFFADV